MQVTETYTYQIFGITLEGTRTVTKNVDFGKGQGVGEVSSSDVTAILNQSPDENSMIYGDRVYIDAEYINLNGIVQSGQQDITLNLTQANIEAAKISSNVTASSVGLVKLTDLSNRFFGVYWDTQNQRILIDEVRASGGDIELRGHLLNTGKGEVRLLSGYSAINVANSSNYDIEILGLDVSQRGAGTLIMADKAKGSSSDPQVTMYEKTAFGDATTTGAESIIDQLKSAGHEVGVTTLLYMGNQSSITEADGTVFTKTASGATITTSTGQVVTISSSAIASQTSYESG